MKRIALIHALLIVAFVVGIIVAVCCGSEAQARWPRCETTYVAQAVPEHSLLVTKVPGKDANVADWQRYVAGQWEGRRHGNGARCSARTGELTPTGEEIDLLETWQLAGGEPQSTVWEFVRAYNWRNAVGRVGRIRARTGETGCCGIVLVVGNFDEDRQYIVDAADACRALGVQFKTVDAKGIIR